MSCLCGELIVDTTEHQQELVSRDCVPTLFRDAGVIIRRESSMSDCLAREDGASRLHDGAFPVGVTNVVLDGHAAFSADWENGRRCFCDYGERGQMPGISNEKLEWNGILAFNQSNAPSGCDVRGVDPRPLLGLHLLQLAAHNSSLVFNILVGAKQDETRSRGGQKQENSRNPENSGPGSDYSITAPLNIVLILIGSCCVSGGMWIFYFGISGRDSWWGLAIAGTLFIIGLLSFGSGIVGSPLIFVSMPTGAMPVSHLAPLDCRSEDARILPVIIAELELGDIGANS